MAAVKKKELIDLLETYRTSSSNENFWNIHSYLYPKEDTSDIAKDQVNNQHSQQHEQEEIPNFQKNVLTKLQYQSKMTEIFQKDLEEIYLSSADFQEGNEDKKKMKQNTIEYLQEMLLCDYKEGSKRLNIERRREEKREGQDVKGALIENREENEENEAGEQEDKQEEQEKQVEKIGYSEKEEGRIEKKRRKK